jgi:hypothetical protein
MPRFPMIPRPLSPPLRHRLRVLVPWGLWGLRIALLACVADLGGARVDSAWAITCPGTATLVVFAENLTAEPSVTLTVAGELRDAAATCAGTGDAVYTATFECQGTGVVRCGTVDGLRPGAWVNRVAVTVPGSAPQAQARPAVLLGGNVGRPSNVVVWTVYPRTFVVGSTDEAVLRQVLDAAAERTADGVPAVLVTFDRAVFPSAAAPGTIDLTTRLCDRDGRHAALCLDGSQIVVDALDARAERGAVVLRADGPTPLLRVYGAGNVLRGVVLEGSGDADGVQADTVAIVGAAAVGNRLEQCVVLGPVAGDAVSVQNGAGGAADNVIDDCEIAGAGDKGVKVTTGGHVTVRESCIHDNANGGIQSTLGGTITAHRNLVQHNVPGSSQSGLTVGAPGAVGARSTLVTDGNIVRFSGARGLAVVDDADAVVRNDYVADNQFTGVRVETTVPGVAPSASFRGVTLACNSNGGITGTCRSAAGEDGALCTADADCCGGDAGCCPGDPGCVTPARCVAPAPQGFGAVLDACATCAAPSVDLGGVDGGRNALTLNVNTYPNAQGANLLHDVAGLVLAARGNQWEHCGVTASCDVGAVASTDVALGAGASVDLGTPPGPRAGIATPLTVSVGRPRAGDLVRVFGTDFNAIDGAACADDTVPVAPCSAANPRVAAQNRGRFGNRVLLTFGDESMSVDVDAVTPTMLAFRMPVDCFAPATLNVSKRDASEVRHGASLPFCDAAGCFERDAGAPCDDANVCTVQDACDGSGRCLPGPPLACGGACMRCDRTLGCVPRASTTSCTDGDGCTFGDRCSGDGDVCVPGARLECDDRDPCTIDSCEPTVVCVHDAVRDFDAVTCRMTRGTDAITRVLGPENRRGRALGRLLANVTKATEAVRTAHANGQIRRTRLRLDRLRTRLGTLLRTVPRRRGLTPELVAELVANLEQALAVVEQMRAVMFPPPA